MDPLITVLVRIYNHPEYIKNSLDSIINQTLSKDLYKILIIDDGSNDEVQNILKLYLNICEIVRIPHMGVNNAAIKGFELSKTKYVILLDSDAYYLPNLLEYLLNSLEKSGNDYALSDYIEIDERTKEIKYMSLDNNIFNTGANGILMKREVAIYDKNLILPEYKLLYNLYKNYKLSYIPIPLIVDRRHYGSVTDNKNLLKEGLEQLKPIFGIEISKIREY